MAYESHNIRRFKVRYDDNNADNPLTYQLVLNGAKITPTSATIATYDASGTAVLTATAMTASGTLLTYSIDTTTESSYPVGNGYRARIVVTYGGVTYEDDVYFDVVKYLLRIPVGFDQLIALDDSVRAMEWNGDTDLSEIIEACRDEIQLRLETKALEDGELIENMLVDASRVAIPFRRYVLAQVLYAKGRDPQAERHQKTFEELFRAMLAGIKYDKNQDLAEDAGTGRVQPVRLVT
jgi:hypothetical protein